jgi:hypothetical protein
MLIIFKLKIIRRFGNWTPFHHQIQHFKNLIQPGPLDRAQWSKVATYNELVWIKSFLFLHLITETYPASETWHNFKFNKDNGQCP